MENRDQDIERVDHKPQDAIESDFDKDPLNTRHRKYTEKARQYNHELLEKKFKDLEKLADKTRAPLKDQDSKPSLVHIRSYYSKWMNDFEEYLEKHNDHLNKLSQQESEDYL